MDSEEELDGEDMVLLARTSSTYFDKNSNEKRGRSSNQKANDIMCFKCKK